MRFFSFRVLGLLSFKRIMFSKCPTHISSLVLSLRNKIHKWVNSYWSNPFEGNNKFLELVCLFRIIDVMKVITRNITPEILLEKCTQTFTSVITNHFNPLYAISRFLLYQGKVYSEHTKIKEDNKTIQAHHATNWSSFTFGWVAK